MQLLSTITCPVCRHTEEESMPQHSCQFFYECKGCDSLLRPKQGDCCVYCSYGSIPCPPVQQARGPSRGDCCPRA